ncbi:M15 family metallopeptidase [Cellulomonas triticagri]|uniref:M15 family peptidase n=1 Tax=Cellulomonas triticagri TaxID=2483352 RepID=A0A3M2JHZ5_9CELL|nr:M15 family metallopeptidase [Cellulomonas triticagri]RMI13382.1 M15 family peptidase [Cellulomonas triticagri]
MVTLQLTPADAPPRPRRGTRLTWLVGVTVVLVAGIALALGTRGTDTAPTGSTGPVSVNGWPAVESGDDPRLAPFPWVTGRVLDGDVHTVLLHVAERFHAEVEPIDVSSSWGWAYRPVRGEDDGLSNHASGTAVDFNATLHPLGASDTFTDAQLVALRAILDEVAPVVAWGGDFDRADEMHLEIVGTPEEVAAVAARLGG